MNPRRKYPQGQIRKNIQRKYFLRKTKNFALLLSFVILGLVAIGAVKNNPQLVKNIDSQKIEGLFNLLNFNLSSIKSLTNELVIDTNETVIPGDSKNIKRKNEFSLLDKKAKSLHYDGNSVQELANLLSQYADTDLEKARIIYSWITHHIAYDVAALFLLKNVSYPDVRAESVLSTRKTICSGYANLYQKIADSMGLKSVIVLGYAKGSDYIVGDDDQVNHAWNAVKINDQWYLLDPTWGAGTVKDSLFKKNFNPYYFATPPDEFIYTHFPEKDKWQLLSQPYARSEFNDLPEVSSTLFNNDVQLISHKTKTIYADNRLDITLKAPKNVVAIANLKTENSEVKDNYTLVQNKGGYITVHTAFPAKGNYKLDIFAKERDNSNYYPHIVTYQIIANNSSEEFPLTYRHFAKNNGYLETPLTKSLTPHQLTYFKLRVDNATAIKVVDQSTSKWTDLIQYGNLFAGSAPIGSGKIVLFAKFPGDARYWALLEYN